MILKFLLFIFTAYARRTFQGTEMLCFQEGILITKREYEQYMDVIFNHQSNKQPKSVLIKRRLLEEKNRMLDENSDQLKQDIIKDYSKNEKQDEYQLAENQEHFLPFLKKKGVKTPLLQKRLKGKTLNLAAFENQEKIMQENKLDSVQLTEVLQDDEDGKTYSIIKVKCLTTADDFYSKQDYIIPCNSDNFYVHYSFDRMEFTAKKSIKGYFNKERYTEFDPIQKKIDNANYQVDFDFEDCKLIFSSVQKLIIIYFSLAFLSFQIYQIIYQLIFVYSIIVLYIYQLISYQNFIRNIFCINKSIKINTNNNPITSKDIFKVKFFVFFCVSKFSRFYTSGIYQQNLG